MAAQRSREEAADGRLQGWPWRSALERRTRRARFRFPQKSKAALRGEVTVKCASTKREECNAVPDLRLPSSVEHWGWRVFTLAKLTFLSGLMME